MLKKLQQSDLYFTVSVSHLAWQDEEKHFAVGFTDGSLKISHKDQNVQTATITAHAVCEIYIMYITLSTIIPVLAGCDFTIFPFLVTLTYLFPYLKY